MSGQKERKQVVHGPVHLLQEAGFVFCSYRFLEVHLEVHDSRGQRGTGGHSTA